MQQAVKKNEAQLTFPTLDALEVKNKTVLVRLDLNVPMQSGRVTDDTRILRQLPTLQELSKKGAKVVILSHFGRPKGQFVPSLSLAPLVDALSAALGGREVKFGVDSVGPSARAAVEALKPGDILLLENLRFYAEEEKGDKEFARQLASLGDVYVNDAFSASHRNHASVVGLAEFLPHAAGRLMQQELEMLQGIFADPHKKVAAIVGGSKISTKLALLEHLCEKMDALIICGAMANTFLVAQGHSIGSSLYEPDLVATARQIMEHARTKCGCEIILPVDVVVAKELTVKAKNKVVPVTAIPEGMMALDIGPATIGAIAQRLMECQIVVWNGPVGAFELSPFDVSTVNLARVIARMTQSGKLQSIAGGGDTVAAVAHAGLNDQFTYLSTAGGAFLEWLEGKVLPGVAALQKAA